MNNLVWLASYPKSGNTWMRIFIEAYQRHGKEIQINQLQEVSLAAYRSLHEEMLFIQTTYLTQDEIDWYRPFGHRALNDLGNEIIFKVHDAWRLNRDGEPLFPSDVTKLVLYVIRNPLDVAVSYAHHNGQPVEATIKLMNKADHYLARLQFDHVLQFEQLVTTWSNHVLSWVDTSNLPVYVIRYEDMSFAPRDTFSGIINALKWPFDAERLDHAIEHSRFDRIKAQEETHGFGEKTYVSENFFRKGKVGDWRERLTDEQVQRIIEDHGDVMRRFGYLTDNDEPVF